MLYRYNEEKYKEYVINYIKENNNQRIFQEKPTLIYFYDSEKIRG